MSIFHKSKVAYSEPLKCGRYLHFITMLRSALKYLFLEGGIAGSQGEMCDHFPFYISQYFQLSKKEMGLLFLKSEEISSFPLLFKEKTLKLSSVKKCCEISMQLIVLTELYQLRSMSEIRSIFILVTRGPFSLLRLLFRSFKYVSGC